MLSLDEFAGLGILDGQLAHVGQFRLALVMHVQRDDIVAAVGQADGAAHVGERLVLVRQFKVRHQEQDRAAAA